MDTLGNTSYMIASRAYSQHSTAAIAALDVRNLQLHLQGQPLGKELMGRATTERRKTLKNDTDHEGDKTRAAEAP